jgi:glycosyltransferase involved in cell wall biosynthesis
MLRSSSTRDGYAAGAARADDVTDVLIDAAALGDDSAYRGIGTYVRSLLGGLAGESSLTVRTLVRGETNPPEGIDSVRLHRAAPGRWRAVEHEFLLPLDVLRCSPQVFHSPALDPPAWCRGPWVQTLHDMIPLVFDAADLAVEARRWRRRAARYRRASKVIAVSKHTASQAVSVLRLHPAKVEVIPHGVNPEFRPASEPDEVVPPHLLLVGEYSERKGYREAFAVIGELAGFGYPHRLRVAGRIAPWQIPRLEQLVGAAQAPERIDLLGFTHDLVREYQQADVLIMTSRYEGFGFPILEAMACGIPVVAFSNSSITEVVGDAGVLVPDGDVPAMVRAVRSVLDDPARRAELCLQGLERARKYSWPRSAALHAELYREVAAG